MPENDASPPPEWAPGAEWRPDPEGEADFRWWDGEKFTDHTGNRRPVAAPTPATTNEDPLKARVIGKANRPALEEIRRQCRPDELPEFIAGETAGGVLAAFEDRCIVIKKGVVTNLMAGSLGGGRVTVFPYKQVTGIEYNSGFVNGSLEILTASYQGTANKDFWRGTFSGRNANSNDPYTLSNTLPFTKQFYEKIRPKVQWMQERITEAHQQTMSDVGLRPPTAAAPAVSVADEIKKLADLYAAGALTDDEFAHAKRTLLEKPS
ncbi:DUF2510 domain-containing protein [Conexibacter sp. W3-3-2]|uniref:SHOCT domain-containing protein n=1 Tax=Conexibacter sp. W3-3-2 TaxID=2675227 RepID=UPI0012B8C16F|nr:SHOCT domain-containing protein [Conexibacter sp. W3-3-2]MTD44148.1 DUF2510 domain-containing protein [Conexibacter sp. W3-3-2]